MTASYLTLHHFRNARQAAVEFSPGVNVVLGDNAQGKTNLLEAISLFAMGKSFRASNEREMISFEQGDCELRLSFSTDRRSGQDMKIRLSRTERRQTSINGVPVTRLADSLGVFRAVLFTPDHLELVKESPETRRKFIDQAICQLKPYYAGILSTFNRSLNQRNALLRRACGEGKPPETIDVWTEKLSELSAEIFKYRYWYIRHLASVAPLFYHGMSRGSEELYLKYAAAPASERPSESFDRNTGDICDMPVNTSGESLRDFYRDFYHNRLHIDLRAGRTVAGPQRDDLHVFVDGRPVRLFGSQGQQRSAVLALKLAEGQVSYDLSGEHPLYLFDDILSELDKNRQEYILNQLNKRQMLVTSCNSEFFIGMNDTRRICVKGGVYEQCTVGEGSVNTPKGHPRDI